VWLVTGGGALFAAFPEVYATAFSGFYTPFILLLFMLIFRAVSIDVRSKQTSSFWRQFWDVAFSVSSIVAAMLIGIALGNIAKGVPLGANFEYRGSLVEQLNPYALLVGVTVVALFMMHASIFLLMKTEGELQTQIRSWVQNAIIFFMMAYVMTTMATLVYVPHMASPFRHNGWLFIAPLISLLAIANIPREVAHGREMRAFLSSAAAIAGLMTLFGIGMFPEMIHSSPNPEFSLTAFNGASSPRTLMVMLIIAVIGIPLVVGYTAGIYWVFRGKVKIHDMSY
jgi:cytochrome d ubiquinol oxidase subunit II